LLLLVVLVLVLVLVSFDLEVCPGGSNLSIKEGQYAPQHPSSGEMTQFLSLTEFVVVAAVTELST